jgi:hypothetical protein
MPAAIPIVSALVAASATAYAANKQTGGNTNAAKITTAANLEATKLQIAAEEKAALLKAEADKAALAKLEQQWNTSQANIAPYMALGAGAASKLSDFMGFPVSMPTATGGSAATSTPNAQANDPAYVAQQVTASFQKWHGRDPTPAELAEWTKYATTPDTFSDGVKRQGWNGYWDSRIKNVGTPNSAIGDVSQAGTDTVIGYGSSAARSPLTSSTPASTGLTTLKDLSGGLADQTTLPAVPKAAEAAPVADTGLAQTGDNALVWMMAPDGSVKRVKQGQAAGYMARGAKLLSGGSAAAGMGLV